MKQIVDRDYGGRYENPVLLALAVYDGPSGEKGARRIASYMVDYGEPPAADVEEGIRPAP